MKSLVNAFAGFLLIPFILVLLLDCSINNDDYMVAADELKIVCSNFVGDALCVTQEGDTVVVHATPSSIIYGNRAKTKWQTKCYYFDVVGFTADSVLVSPRGK